MKEILFIHPLFDPHPWIWWVTAQIKLLHKHMKGIVNFTIFTPKLDKTRKNKETINWITVIRYTNIIEFFWFVILNANKYNLIKISLFYKESLFIWLLKLFGILKVPTIVTSHSGWGSNEIAKIKQKLRYSFLVKVYFFIVSKNNYLNCLNKYIENELLALWIKQSKLTYILNGIEIKWTKNKKITKIKNILFLSRVVEEKGIFEAIEAFKSINKDNEIKFTIVGDVDNTIKDNFLEKIKDDNIVYLWPLYWSKKQDIIDKSDLFLFPTYYPEWQPNVLLEMASSWLIIISTENWNTKELYWDSIIYTIPKNIDDLEEKILYAIKNYNKISNDYSKVLKKVDINLIVSQYLDLMK